MQTTIRKAQGGVPKGGALNQALLKFSSGDYDYDWGDVSGGGGVTSKNDVDTTWDMNDASGLLTIPHGLGSIPSTINLVAADTIGKCISWGQSNTVDNSCDYAFRGTNADPAGSNGSFAIIMGDAGSATIYQEATVTADATNIYIHFTKVSSFGGGANKINIAWQVLGAGASGSDFTVNADETLAAWFMAQILAPHVTSTGVNNTEWIVDSQAHWFTHIGNGGFSARTTGGQSAYTALYNMLKGANAAQLTFGSGTNAKLKGVVSAQPGVGVSSGIGTVTTCFFGLDETTAANDDGDITLTANRRIGFAFYNGKIYAICCDGSAITATIVDNAYSAEALHLFEIVINGTTSVDFYYDGVKTSITTHVPTANAAYLQFLADGVGNNAGFPFISHMTYGQKLT